MHLKTNNSQGRATIATLPSKFCWTKMGDEAGQGLSGIISRKDTERQLGDGIFFWGIGTPLGERIWSFIKSTDNPQVFFSPMKAKPKTIDINPDKVFAWTAYVDRHGRKHVMPDHALVTSRGTAREKTKDYHYALVCHKHTQLEAELWPAVCSETLRNYKTGKRLGYSQVTSIVESTGESDSCTLDYSISFGADLVAPFYVKLVDPVEIPRKLWSEANDLWAENRFCMAGWKEWLSAKRPRFRKVGSLARSQSHGQQQVMELT